MGFNQFSDVNKITILKCFISFCKVYFSVYPSCTFSPLNKMKCKDCMNIAADRCQSDSLRKQEPQLPREDGQHGQHQCKLLFTAPFTLFPDLDWAPQEIRYCLISVALGSAASLLKMLRREPVSGNCETFMLF